MFQSACMLLDIFDYRVLRLCIDSVFCRNMEITSISKQRKITHQCQKSQIRYKTEITTRQSVFPIRWIMTPYMCWRVVSRHIIRSFGHNDCDIIRLYCLKNWNCLCTWTRKTYSTIQTYQWKRKVITLFPSTNINSPAAKTPMVKRIANTEFMLIPWAKSNFNSRL